MIGWFVVAFLYYPNLAVVGSVLSPAQGMLAETLTQVFGSARVLAAIRDTLIVAVISVVTVNIFGIAQTFLLDAVRLRGRGLLTLAFAVPLVFGSVSAVTGYNAVYGSNGLLTGVLQRVFHGLPGTWFSGMAAVLVVHTFTMTGYHFLFLRPALRRIDFSMVEAARSLVRGTGYALFRVVLPLLRPMPLATTLMVFTGAVGSFAAPNILGGGGFQMVGPLVLALSKLGRPDMAAVLGLALSAITVGALIWALRAERRSARAGSKFAQPFRPIRIRNPFLRAGAHGVASLLAVVNLLPLVATVYLSLLPASAIRTLDFGAGLTVANYVQVFSNPAVAQPLLNSLAMIAVAIPAAGVIGTVLAYLLHRRPGPLTDAIQVSLFLPYFLPAVVLALGFTIAFGTATPLVGGQVLIGGYWILPLAYTVMLLPTAIRFVRASYTGIDPALDEAGRSLGAGSARRFLRLSLPLLLPVLLQVAALGFNQTFEEYTVSVMLYNVNNQPLGVTMGSLAASDAPGLAGIATSYVVISTVPAVVVVLFADRMAARSARQLHGRPETGR
ncbi:ABC transporter permease [Leifsonia xyli subsp. xyli]|uniref:ABC transporter permease n=2 Tax=Leifsonia xyli subsp. xyli TaxID=59736 RepID=A0A1E2SM10_LEIXY|nr:iron ABC transporter permease [Leifsonia xyli]AAT89225.1 probable ABC transporter permease protein [Leifsonia xyli subsp. xyli str. CTCB07]ODA90876.1 ABC transporter permease [Leifsonia xyli subsp. xyli]